MPEAVASVTYRLVSPMGYPALLTFRQPDPDSLLDLMAGIEAQFVDMGFEPDQKTSKFTSPTPSSPTKRSYSKPQNSYNKNTSYGGGSRYGATQNQISLILDKKDQWGLNLSVEEIHGLSKSEASEIITNHFKK